MYNIFTFYKFKKITKLKKKKKLLDNLLKKENFAIYWNKVYEPNYLKFDDYLKKSFKTKNISYHIFKGNILNEPGEVKKDDGTPFKVFTPFWRKVHEMYFSYQVR